MRGGTPVGGTSSWWSFPLSLLCLVDRLCLLEIGVVDVVGIGAILEYLLAGPEYWLDGIHIPNNSAKLTTRNIKPVLELTQQQ